MIPFFGASLKLLPYQKLVVLHPAREHPDDKLPYLYGDIVLSLPAPRAVESVVVRHVVKYTVTLPGQKREQGVLQTSEVDIPLPAVLQAGENTYSWALQVPENTAPRESAATGSVTHMLQAVAVGAGFGGSNLKDEVEVYMVHGHVEASSTLLHLEGVNELGPYALDLDSPHLTVGGLLRFHLRLAHSPSPLHIRSISLSIEQTSSARPPAEPLTSPTFISRRIPIFFLGHTTPRRPPSQIQHWAPGTLHTEAARPHDGGLLAVLPAACEVNFDYVSRLPDHRSLRPTSDAASPAFVRVAHKAVVQVRYWAVSAPEGKEQIVHFSRPLQLSYCCCRLDAVLLPTYGQEIAQSETGLLGCACACACTLSADRLWEMHGALVSPEAADPSPPAPKLM
ncbi:hypothetical protein AURDEDRAFT_175186 [Auricularia subglabra TFB-10046 SS5]|nr:hypothetical protein AURDEDRAFT_175186 [Auricularia subglabra TFB-10046 SS5]